MKRILCLALALAACGGSDDGDDSGADAMAAAGGMPAASGGCPDGLHGVTEGKAAKGSITFTFQGVERTLCPDFVQNINGQFFSSTATVIQPDNDPGGVTDGTVGITIQSKLAVGTHAVPPAGSSEPSATAHVNIVVGNGNGFTTSDIGIGAFTVARADEAGVAGTFDVEAQAENGDPRRERITGSFDLSF